MYVVTELAQLSSQMHKKQAGSRRCRALQLFHSFFGLHRTKLTHLGAQV